MHCSVKERLPPGWIVFAQGGARQKLAGDGPVGHVLVGKREKNLLMVGGGPPEAPTMLHQAEKKSV